MTSDRETAPRRLDIKKYPNRRYYDATHSRHLTLEEIHALIQQGFDLRVVDARSGEDITAEVLTQIILEHDKAKLNSLPVPLLVRLIRVNDQLIKDFVEQYFNQALQSFLEYQRKFEDQIRHTHSLSGSLPSVAAWTRAVLEPFSAFAAGSPAPASPDTTNRDDLRQAIQALRQEVAELSRRQEPAPGNGARPRRVRRGPPRRRTK